ncbi:hypothetical protein [Streptomyces sp. GSL17-111]|uniref:hypothetical protein n=1 Tax=Streptomyces sp. GSL17-111 TaxID=3121596 RepID=UPI0030F44BAF
MSEFPQGVREVFAQLRGTEVGRLLAADRRQGGQELPTIPVPEVGVELTRAEAACALFESSADELGNPDTDTLSAALCGGVRSLGVEGVRAELGTFCGLGDEFWEVVQCWRWAHRLTLAYWYAGARSRAMTAGEVAVCLYLSDLRRCQQEDVSFLSARSLLVSQCIRQGAERVPAETLVGLGESVVAELGVPAKLREPVSWLYRQVMPDFRRRRLCFALAHAHSAREPAPLVVRLDDGGYALGTTAPREPGPAFYRPLHARW